MNLLYDLHTHILPAIDDGAKSTKEALKLVSELKQYGVKNVCFTPHFYTHKESVEDFLKRREQSISAFISSIPDGINVRVGAEVYITDYLFAEEHDLTQLCITGTRYMITEFPYNASFSRKSMKQLNRIRDYGIIPIIPHIERYPNLMKNLRKLDELVDSGVMIQSNIASFVDPKLKRKLIKLLQNNYIHILSTDVHSLDRNPPRLIPAALDYIATKCGEEQIQILNKNASPIFFD